MNLGTPRARIGMVLVLLGAAMAGHGAWIPAKAWLAQQLRRSAWASTVRDGGIHRPWGWADHWPVALLRVPASGIELIVLEGDSGNVLAFGPGHAIRSGMPGGHRTVVISGHRDTHFRFLQQLQPGAVVEIETAAGAHRYRVTGAAIVDSRLGGIAVHEDGDELLLVTCYPFDALRAGGPLRYLVSARPR